MKRYRGFTLVELFVALFIFSLMFTLTFMQLRPGVRNQANARSLAMLLAAELRAARQKAVGSQMPVALVIPSQNGARAHAQSLYILEGHLPPTSPDPLLPPTPAPRISRVTNFAGDMPGTYIFVGSWSIDAAQLSSPGLTPTITSPSQVSLQGWSTGNRDYIFTFLPDGSLTTNDLPHFDGAYHLVVATNLNYSAASAPPGTASMTTPPSYFQLTAVTGAMTLAVSPSGSVSVQDGVTAQNALVDAGGGAPALSAAPAPAQPTVAVTSPVIGGVVVAPDKNPATAGAFDATVALGKFMTLRIKVQDADGDRCTIVWNSTSVVGSGGPGTFSCPAGSQQMRWDSALGCWISDWIWQPPPGAAAGDQFRLDCTITDTRGNSTSLTGSARIDVEARRDGTIAFSDGGRLCVMEGDATGIRDLGPGLDPQISPDGSTIAFTHEIAPGNDELCLIRKDGTGLRVLSTDGACREACWSPDGTRLAYARDPDGVGVGAPPTVVIRNLRTGVETAVAADAGRPAWSGNKMAYVSPVGIGARHIWLCDVTSLATPHIDITPTPVIPTTDWQDPMWLPDGVTLLAVDRTDPLSDMRLCSIATSGPPGNSTELLVYPQIHDPFLQANNKLLFVGGTPRTMWRYDFSGSTLSGPVALRQGAGMGPATHPTWGP